MVAMQLVEASFLEFYVVKGHVNIEYASTVSFNMVIDDNGVLLLPMLYNGCNLVLAHKINILLATQVIKLN